MRRIVYRVAASLDGYIAGPNGEIDWIVHDPTADFASIYSRFDTALLGRRTYELTQQPGAPLWPQGWRIYVVSRTLSQAGHSAVTVVGTDVEAIVRGLREESGSRDIWLFGGSSLFASLLRANLVDRVEVAVMPAILGGGTRLVGENAGRCQLTLVHSAASSNGIVDLQYDVQLARGEQPSRQ